MSKKRSSELIDAIPVDRRPRHVAIIMDGNGRWAQHRGRPRFEGHRQGAKAVRRAMAACQDLGVEFLTLYCFSSENWRRPKPELDFLMKQLRTYLIRERKSFVENGVRLKVIGKREGLPADVLTELDKTLEVSRNGTFTLCLAINYGSRDEIVSAVQRIAADVVAGKTSLEAISPETISQHLDTFDMPDPDLLIRTAGEFRISNFLLWQISYTELWITEKHWPDFEETDLIEAVSDYACRDRRFGGLREENASQSKSATEPRKAQTRKILPQRAEPVDLVDGLALRDGADESDSDDAVVSDSNAANFVQ
jgi:undecaprenyl diphosphate synthase